MSLNETFLLRIPRLHVYIPVQRNGLLGGLHPASGPRRALPRQTQHAANRTQASDLTDRINRLVRQTLCFVNTTQRHDTVIGFFVNRDACGRAVYK